jgi:hypothetical protein
MWRGSCSISSLAYSCAAACTISLWLIPSAPRNGVPKNRSPRTALNTPGHSPWSWYASHTAYCCHQFMSGAAPCTPTLRTTKPPKLCAMKISGRSTQTLSYQSANLVQCPQPGFLLLPTFLCRFSAVSSLVATFRADCLIASGPNQLDLYPYRIMRALGTAAGSISSSSNQLTH